MLCADDIQEDASECMILDDRVYVVDKIKYKDRTERGKSRECLEKRLAPAIRKVVQRERRSSPVALAIYYRGPSSWCGEKLSHWLENVRRRSGSMSYSTSRQSRRTSRYEVPHHQSNNAARMRFTWKLLIHQSIW